MYFSTVCETLRGRYSDLERPPSAKVMSLLPPDGSQVALTELRQVATKRLHMSPSTLTKELRDLEETKLITREVDVSAHPPRIHYKRRINVPPGQFVFDDWFRGGWGLIRGVLLVALEEIAEDPKVPLEKLYTLTRVTEEDGTTTSSNFETFVLERPWHILTEFQRIMQSSRVQDREKLVHRIREEIETLGEPFTWMM